MKATRKQLQHICNQQQQQLSAANHETRRVLNQRLYDQKQQITELTNKVTSLEKALATLNYQMKELEARNIELRAALNEATTAA